MAYKHVDPVTGAISFSDTPPEGDSAAIERAGDTIKAKEAISKIRGRSTRHTIGLQKEAEKKRKAGLLQTSKTLAPPPGLGLKDLAQSALPGAQLGQARGLEPQEPNPDVSGIGPNPRRKPTPFGTIDPSNTKGL